MRLLKYFIFIMLSIVTALFISSLIYAIIEKKGETPIFIEFIAAITLCLVLLYFLGKNINKNRRINNIDNINFKSSKDYDIHICDINDIPHKEILEISDIIANNNIDKISKELIYDKAKILKYDIDSFLSNIIYDVIYEITVSSKVLSKEQEASIRNLFSICDVEITEELEEQFNKYATIRNLLSFKDNPRGFISKSLSPIREKI